uniref:C-type lectin domain-containing protein n=1 Tax=Lates calcarifer TaxID=8187 RepID=A0A4W6DLP1_LATCA
GIVFGTLGTKMTLIVITLVLLFVADTNANGKSYVFISTEKTWQEAQAYCREYHTDLALIENAEDNEAVRSLNAQSIAWIGLYRVPWTWSDKSSSNFTNWASGSPDNIDGDEHCVAEYLDSKWIELIHLYCNVAVFKKCKK